MARTAIITRASRGIGRTIAKRLASDGSSVVVNYASGASQADAVVAEIKPAGGQAIAISADVSNPTEVGYRLLEQRAREIVPRLRSVHCVEGRR